MKSFSNFDKNNHKFTLELQNEIQEQQTIIENQQKQINELTKRLEVLEKK
jgi:uncharacterized coiled-coil protein SlyX